MADFSIRTKKELLDPPERDIFEQLQVGKCKTVNAGDMEVEVCKVDEETAEFKVRPKPKV